MSAVCEVKSQECSTTKEMENLDSLESRFPEIQWLKDGEVTVTQEGVCSINSDAIEYQRTLLTIRCLDLIVKGGENAYHAFTQAQKADALTRKAFDSLHNKVLYFQEKLNLSSDRLHLLLSSALVLGDMGKTEKARETFASIKTPDHDDFEKEALQVLKVNPSLCPTFKALTPAEQDILINATGLIHFGHVYHLEGGPEMFTHLKNASVDEATLEFALFVQRCDVAGALGHRNPDASVTFTQTTYEMYEAVGNACKVLLNPSNNELDAYNTFLEARGKKVGLDSSTPEGQVLTRIAAMLRVFSPEQLSLYRNAYEELTPDEVCSVNRWFYHNKIQEHSLTPTYIPAVLLNLVGTIGVEDAIKLGLPCIAKGLEKFANEGPSGMRACFNPLAGQAKEPNARSLFQNGEIQIDLSNGNITLKESIPSEKRV